MDNRLHNPVRNLTRLILVSMFITVYSAVLPDIDHFGSGRELPHNIYVWMVACVVFVGVTFISRWFRARVLKHNHHSANKGGE